MSKPHILAVAAVALLLVAARSREPEDVATHVIVGTVRTVQVSWTSDLLFIDGNYDTTVEVETGEKGDGLKLGDVVRLRYYSDTFAPVVLALILMAVALVVWREKKVQRKWLKSLALALTVLMASISVFRPGGFKDFPREGQRVRALLVYGDRWSRGSDGGYRPLFPHWATVLSEDK
jgi:hypothetical protein